MINPDAINEGDEVTVASHPGGIQQLGTVVLRRGSRLIIDMSGDLLSLELSGKRAPYQIVAHRPWLRA